MTVYQTPGLRGLELWRGIAQGLPLFQLREHRSAYLQGVREFLVALHRGEATAADEGETEQMQQAAGFQRVVLCGGDALDPALQRFMRADALPFAVEIDPQGPFAARQGALRIFEAEGWRRGAALDLGQLQLKAMTARRSLLLPRDLAQLPFGAEAIDPDTARARLRGLIADGLSRLATLDVVPGEQPDGVVLALPVELDADGVAEPATYPGLFGPVEPIFAGLFPCPCVVLNDAVLAGFGFPPNAGEKTLVVTLGFGVGGALWTA